MRRFSSQHHHLYPNGTVTVEDGLLGAGLGAALTREQGRWVGVPVGAAAGAMVGCQVDGG